MVNFLFANELLPYYGVGLFVGFFGNLVVRGVGTVMGGRVGEGLLEIAALRDRPVEPADVGEGEGKESA